ncbi:MAG: putative Zn-dependent peptidase [Planctomycetota bacterium]|jgi:predicted Zn-dependent peptidase
MKTLPSKKTNWVEEGMDECVHHRILDCGLAVKIALKKGLQKKYALFGTNYGSIDNDFTTSLRKGRQRLPAGIAHFLEHKMFEKEDGDVMERLEALGCSSNAMTSFNHTGYLIECTDSFQESLGVLVDFVTNPWFTPALVDKEKGIIAEEINMYRDDPSWRGYMGVLESLYANHPVSVDIAGTVESIQSITADDLYLCHNTFYSPGNMQLAIAGDCDPNEVCDIVEEIVARNNPGPVEFKRHRRKPRKKPSVRRQVANMPVSGPKLNLGFRFDPLDLGVPIDEVEMSFDLFMASVLGKGTEFYSDLYRSNLIDDSFGYSVSVEREYGFIMFSADTGTPEKLEAAILAGFKKVLAEGPNAADLRRARRSFYGSFVRGLDSVSTACWNLTDCHVKDAPYLGHGKQLMKLKLDRIMSTVRKAIEPAGWASYIIKPMDK